MRTCKKSKFSRFGKRIGGFLDNSRLLWTNPAAFA